MKKTQPQKLLESILPEPNEDEKFSSDPDIYTMGKKEFPTINEQLKHWDDKERAEAPRPIETLDTRRKKWTLARRRKFNATVAKKTATREASQSKEGWSPVAAQESVPQVKHCPFCGKSIERFLA